VTGMGTPGTYRVSDGSRVEFAAALAALTTEAAPVLERVARTYHATVSYLTYDTIGCLKGGRLADLPVL
jgi:hypothetical protein